jgi:hypothetical protein
MDCSRYAMSPGIAIGHFRWIVADARLQVATQGVI